MIKKIILASTLVFLLFEVMYFQSNIAVKEYASIEKEEVYTISLLEDEANFKDNYEEIILEENENQVIILTTKSKMQEITENYNIKIEN